MFASSCFVICVSSTEIFSSSLSFEKPSDQPMTEPSPPSEVKNSFARESLLSPTAISVARMPDLPLVKNYPLTDGPEPLLSVFGPSSPFLSSSAAPSSAQAISRSARPVDPRRRPSDALSKAPDSAGRSSPAKTSSSPPTSAAPAPHQLRSPVSSAQPGEDATAGTPATISTGRELLSRLETPAGQSPLPTLTSRVFKPKSLEEDQAYQVRPSCQALSLLADNPFCRTFPL